MNYIIRMSIGWKEKLQDIEDIVLFNENIKDKTIDIEIEDIDIFTSKNNFHIEHEILMPGLIKLGLEVVGIIIYPNFRDEKIEKLIIEFVKRPRKYGMHIILENTVQDYDTIGEKYLENMKKSNK